jgi:hypothetical protein
MKLFAVVAYWSTEESLVRTNNAATLAHASRWATRRCPDRDDPGSMAGARTVESLPAEVVKRVDPTRGPPAAGKRDENHFHP